MGMANSGIGLAALVNGLNGGMDLGNKIKTQQDENAIRDQAQQGLAEAKDRRTQNIADQIQLVGDGSDGAPQQYKVAGKEYADIGSAQKAAESSVGSVNDFFNKHAAPKIRDTYLQQGNMQKAQTWDNWIQSSQVQTGMKHWANAVRAAQDGDADKFADSISKAYNTNGYFDDGTKVTKSEAIKDEKGNTTGYQLTFKDPSGKEATKTFNGMEDLYHQAIGIMSPNAVFEYGWKELESAKAAKAAREGKVLDKNLKVAGEKELLGVKHSNKLEEIKAEDAGKMERTKVTANRLRAAGGADDLSPTGKTIRDLQAVGVPKERAISLATDSKSNPASQRLAIYNSIVAATKAAGEDLPADAELQKRVDSAYKMINQLSEAGDTEAPAASDTTDEDFSGLWK